MILIKKKRNPGWEIDKKELPEGYIPPRTVSDTITLNLEELFEYDDEDIFKSLSYILCVWNQGNYCLDKKDKPVHAYLCVCEKCDECVENY